MLSSGNSCCCCCVHAFCASARSPLNYGKKSRSLFVVVPVHVDGLNPVKAT